MMPNVSRGDRMGGLLRYLQGPGKANEHTNPHLVGGDDTLMSWFGREELSAGDAQAVARHLDAPFVEAAAQGAAEVQGGHVWHCSLSLPAREGQLSDDQWQQIASDFIAEMRWMVPAATQAPDAAREGILVGSGTVGGAPAGGTGGTAAGSIGGSVNNPDSHPDSRGVIVTETSAQSTAESSDAGPGSAAMRGGSVGRVPAVLRWAAVRHGLSRNGNDHVHLVVNLVAEGGGVANTYNDFLRAQKATRALERKHGLVQLASATQGLSTRGWQPAEQQAAARRTAIAATEHARLSGTSTTGWSDLDAAARKAAIAGATKTAGGALGEALGMDQPRRVLEVAVRGASAASRTEGEFVRRLRDAGVLVRARFEKGSTTAVSGFSVALPPRYSASLGEHPVWFGGGTLARDLTLPRLRSGWEQTETTTGAAAAEWNATNRARRAVAAPSTRRERKTFSSAQMVAHAQQVAAMSQRLAQVPAQDRPVWAKVAGHSAGTLSAWAISAARSGDPQSAALAPKLAAAAAVLSTSASTVAAPPPAETAGTIPLSGMAMLLASAARGGQGPVGQAVLLTQMVTLLEAVAEMAAVRRDLNTVQSLRSEVQGHLAEVRAALVTQGAPSANTSAMTASSTPSSTLSRTRVGSAYGIAAGAQREPVEQAGQKLTGGARAGSAAAARATTADPSRTHQSRPVVSPAADRAGQEVESTVELTRRLVAGERARRLAAQARAAAPQPTAQTPAQPTTQTPAAAPVASPTPDKPTTAAAPANRAAHASVEQAAAARRAAAAKAAAEQAAHRRRRQSQATSQDREGPVR